MTLTTSKAEYLREWRRNHPESERRHGTKRRTWGRAFIVAVKLERGCIDCGFNKWPEALEFDHLPGSKKKAAVGTMVTYKEEAIWAEIEKCEVVCANCHAHRTEERRGAWVQHKQDDIY